MRVFIVILVLVYLLIAQRFFRLWFKLFQQDSSMSLEEKRFSKIVLVIGTVFWPIVVPISYWILLEKKLNHHEMPVEEGTGNDAHYYSDQTRLIVLDSIKC